MTARVSGSTKNKAPYSFLPHRCPASPFETASAAANAAFACVISMADEPGAAAESIAQMASTKAKEVDDATSVIKPDMSLRLPCSTKNKKPQDRTFCFLWRRGWDSNPRAGITRPSDFESAPL